MNDEMNDETNDETTSGDTGDEQDVPAPPEADQALLAALGESIADPVPPGLIGRARGLLAWADVDGDLAALLDDADRELVGTRGGAAPTSLEFVTDGGIVVELAIADGADGGTLDGQVLGDEVLRIVLEHATADPEELVVDDLGAFAFQSAVAGAARLRIETRDHGVIRTDWFVL